MNNNIALLLKIARVNTLMSFAALIIFFIISTIVDKGDKELSIAITLIVIKILPLLAFLPGVIRGNTRTHSWLCFVLLAYFIFAVLVASLPQCRTEGIVFSLLTADVFVSAMMYVKWKKQSIAHAGH